MLRPPRTPKVTLGLRHPRCSDRNRISGGGVTAGIDFGLVLLAKLLLGADIAEVTQLALEYDPAPPFDAGTPQKAGPLVMKKMQEWLGRRLTR